MGLLLVFCLLGPDPAWAAEGGGQHTLLASISISILVATIVGVLAILLKQPLILAYIVGGVIIGPQIGFSWVENKADIDTIAEIGLILLLFMIGLELNLKKVRESGKSLIISGTSQFIMCAAMGLGFFFLLGFTIQATCPCEYYILGVKVVGGRYDLLYLAACLAISSTTIVVKLLYEKFELGTLAGRLTLGILIFQDLWAIVLLGLQPNLADPQVLVILWSFAKGAFLVVISLLMSKYGLGYLFKRIAKLPELVLVASLGWCFLVAGAADRLGLSMEMGALIAGVAISTFPYNLDIIGKIINIRDFFITLFFVALGMVIPNPLNNLGLMALALLLAVFLMSTRFLSIFPVLYWLGNGNRVSLLTSINLSQLSEFSLVIAVIGTRSGHIGPDIMTLIIFVFVVTSIASTYMIKYSHGLQQVLGKVVERLGFRPIREQVEDDRLDESRDVALLGFFRVASSWLAEIETVKPEMKSRLVVVDFNPVVYSGLVSRHVKVVYGDISNMQTLHHAGLEHAKVIISTITDDILVGTDNRKLISQIKVLNPQAKIVVTAESLSRTLELYEAGADYVLRPNEAAAVQLFSVVEHLLRGEEQGLKEAALTNLSRREEILK
ncbi:MAG: sodium:proton exchanger [Deltaproteobacteria bacterium]|nr:sodium:proton exchanger [Deltaproteobacteria bacterium]